MPLYCNYQQAVVDALIIAQIAWKLSREIIKIIYDQLMNLIEGFQYCNETGYDQLIRPGKLNNESGSWIRFNCVIAKTV